MLTTADEFDPLGFVVRGVLPVVAAPPGRPALQQGQRLLRRLLFARYVRHKTFEVFYKNIRTTLLFLLVLGNMPPVGSRGLVPRASISRDLPLSTTWGRAGSGLVAPCEVGKWLLPHLPDTCYTWSYFVVSSSVFCQHCQCACFGMDLNECPVLARDTRGKEKFLRLHSTHTLLPITCSLSSKNPD